jgi:hypothetical protein
LRDNKVVARHIAQKDAQPSSLKNIKKFDMKKFGFTPEAEILNARFAMIGFVAAVGAYFTTGQIIPGVW